MLRYDEHTYLWDPCNTSLKDLCALKKQTLQTYGRCKLRRVGGGSALPLTWLSPDNETSGFHIKMSVCSRQTLSYIVKIKLKLYSPASAPVDRALSPSYKGIDQGYL